MAEGISWHEKALSKYLELNIFGYVGDPTLIEIREDLVEALNHEGRHTEAGEHEAAAQVLRQWWASEGSSPPPDHEPVCGPFIECRCRSTGR